MSAITVEKVNFLRQRTGEGLIMCKKALVAHDGDIEGAIEYLREVSLAEWYEFRKQTKGKRK